jgi:hypothetical protein
MYVENSKLSSLISDHIIPQHFYRMQGVSFCTPEFYSKNKFGGKVSWNEKRNTVNKFSFCEILFTVTHFSHIRSPCFQHTFFYLTQKPEVLEPK